MARGLLPVSRVEVYKQDGAWVGGRQWFAPTLDSDPHGNRCSPRECSVWAEPGQRGPHILGFPEHPQDHRRIQSGALLGGRKMPPSP